ncbi:MAG: NAD(P)H-binding protein [Parvibaculum sp.]|uniref:NAD(P)H-binding protein n=1 Tax=Parvibaculum sp. TaxID=2024848 RepID=UPI002ABBA5B3|nr:NAD(P)H-binding protein [Parvibaculum sp.]MDZ4382118.1 NAD(P)H-binding protein [Parvibaculum sp.]
MNGKTTLVAGGTGLVGRHLIRQLIADTSCSKIVALTRRPFDEPSSSKLHVAVVDFDAPDGALQGIAAEDAYCALGTTIKVAGSQAAFRKVDHDYIVAFARAAKAAGAKRFMLVSAIGADPASSIFYSRVKGETERDVAAIGFEALHIFRPGILLGARAERRPLERIGMELSPFLNALMLGPARAYRAIAAETVAGAMRGAAASNLDGRHIHAYDAMNRLAGV